MAYSMKHRENLQFVAEHYGTTAQLDKTIEELDELKAAIDRRQFGGDHGIVEECADVLNMIEQIMLLTGTRERVMDIAAQKMARTVRRIKEERK